MKIERAIAALKEIREGAERMVKLYEDDVIPKAVTQKERDKQCRRVPWKWITPSA